MRLAKADQEDFTTVKAFLHACDELLDKRPYSMRSEESGWKHWNTDDPDYKLCLGIQKMIAEQEGIDLDDVDDRLIAYEFLKIKFSKGATGWNRVVLGCEILIDAACDPMLTYLDWYPGIELFHVANEQ